MCSFVPFGGGSWPTVLSFGVVLSGCAWSSDVAVFGGTCVR